MKSENPLWGIDLGGTKIEIAVLSGVSDPAVLTRQRCETAGEKGYQHVLRQIKFLLADAQQATGLTPLSVGIGTPGTLDPQTHLLRGSNSQHLLDQPIQRDLQALLDMPVYIANDANCFALAEARMGAGRKLTSELKSVFGAILGTGVGGGIVINDQLLSGCNLIAGEWGHNVLEPSGIPCYCGKSGCVETLISGPALEQYYRSLSGQTRPLAEIVERSKNGHPDKAAVSTVNRLLTYFGIGIASVINLVDPDMIVIGGGVGNIDALYSEGIEEIKKHVFTPTLKTLVVKPALGDSAGVFGAAYLTA